MDVIKICGLEVSTCHGVLAFEKVTPQKFIFDADIYLDFYKSAVTDNLNLTVSYAEICTQIVNTAQACVYNLIEKLAYECAFRLMENFAAINKINLTVWKPEAPVNQKFKNVGVAVEVERVEAYLSLGSSMGDKKYFLDSAIDKLGKTRGIKVERVSDYISTPPYGGVAKNGFLNCAVAISTFLSPFALLDEIHRIEEECGRKRDKRWDDRTLDIDIIFFGDKQIHSSKLIVPHPDYSNRDFVIKPLKQIMPQFIQYKINN